jgi:hypothetical protein
VNIYGEQGDYDCLGVKLFLIVGNEYNEDVEATNSAVFRKEKFLKRELKGDTVSGRGTERVKTNLRKLFRLIFQLSNMASEDIETKRRTSERLKQAEVKATDKVVRILDAKTFGRSKTRYLTEWNRPYIDKKTGEKVYTTLETYTKLKSFPNGEQAVAEYEDEHPNKTFVH